MNIINGISTNPEYFSGLFDVVYFSRYADLVALFFRVGSVGVREVDVALGLLHHGLDRVATLADYVRVLHVPNVYLQHHLAPRTTLLIHKHTSILFRNRKLISQVHDSFQLVSPKQLSKQENSKLKHRDNSPSIATTLFDFSSIRPFNFIGLVSSSS